ncbi:MAG TPA: phospholipid carrier-dependent glycosyltransferase, partial [Gammaproteobacteria bacterium]|nr:phospholipid carrier-dependent glycosyltransferase [Gammaproteobacteria bacterium]
TIKYFEKPVLYYWLSAAAIKIAGLSIGSIRGVNAILGLLGCLLTYVTACRLYGRLTGLLAALILGTSLLYFVMAQMISLDLPVTVFLAATLYAFILGYQYPPGNKTRRAYFWGAAASAALAVLTKGLIGIVLPLLVIAAWLMMMQPFSAKTGYRSYLKNSFATLTQLYLPSCLLVFLLIAAPWHLLVGYYNPEFFYFYFIEQHVLRYATKAIGHYQPVWYFIPILILGLLPWVVFLPQAIAASLPRHWQQRQNAATPLFFLLWAVLIFIFFSFSKSKLIPYILPVFPPLAILLGHYLSKKIFINASARLRITLISMITFAWLFLLTLLIFAPQLDTRTILPLAKKLRPILTPQDEVITYNQYYQDLPFYLERRISILNWRNELTFGMQHQDTRAWMIDNDTFWRRWYSQQRVFVIMSLSEYEVFKERFKTNPGYVLGKTTKHILVANKIT